MAARCGRFFEDYKKNENKEVKIDDFLNAEEAKKAIKQSMVSNHAHCQPLAWRCRPGHLYESNSTSLA